MSIFSFIDRSLHAADLNFWWMARRFGLAAGSYCDLETTDGESVFVASDGSLMTMLRLGGTSRLVGDENFGDVVDALAGQLGVFLRQPAHSVQIVIVRDNGIEALDRELTEALNPALLSARRLGMDLDDMLREKAIKLAKHCAVERAYIVLWTSAQALSAVERQRARLNLADAVKLPVSPEAQRPVPPIPALRETHQSLVDTLKTDLVGLGYHTTLMSVSAAMKAMRYEVDPEWTDDGWVPAHPGSVAVGDRSYRTAEPGQHPSDFSHLLWPTLARQLIPRGVEPLSTTAVRIGERIYQPVTLSMPPARLEPFSTLFDRLREAGLCYRISFRLTGHGVQDTEISVRRLFSTLSTSTAVKEALKEAADQSLGAVPRIGMQMEATTWVDNDDLGALKRAASRLARAIQGWGGCDVDERMGNPITPVIATCPGLLQRGVGTLSVPPIHDAIALLPVLRPSSPWKTGAMLFRTPDGKLYPYQPYSKEQSAWVTLVYAPQGGGKSVMLNALNTALCLAPGSEAIPHIAILDIGTSSFGHISLIREALPAHQRHLVQHRRLRMTREDAINPCDTLLGMRRPLPTHRVFLANFLSLLATGVDQAAPLPDVPNVIGTAIDLAYELYSDDGSEARRYDRFVDPQVDARIEEVGLEVDDRTTWWEIVDGLFEAGDVQGAYLAQRYAVPLIGEVAALCKTPKVADNFGGVAPNQERITDYTYRCITQAVREYPILSSPTRFELGGAHIVALDLAEVAPRGGPAADRQTAIMYMLGRHVLASDFFVTTEDIAVAKMPAFYRDFHVSTIRRAEAAQKRIVYDELHRTKSASTVRVQLETDIREGRKANFEIVLASQMLSDFSPAMIDLCTTVLILGVGQKTREETIDTFHLGPEAVQVLDRLNKPTSAGARFLGMFRTVNGSYTHELMHTLSATELWAYSTTAEDRSIRNQLYARIGPAAARHILSRLYPGGTAIGEVERRREKMGERGSGILSDSDATIIDALVREAIEAYEEALLASGGHRPASTTNRAPRAQETT